jgi:ribosomal-protein-alanine N-acetyltransferase
LREGGLADLPEVMLIMREAFDPVFGEAWTEAQCAGIMGMSGSWLLIATTEAGPAGFALSRAVAGEAELLLLGVRPGWRRQGVGRALLDRVIADARARGVVPLHLEVRAGNDAIGLYLSSGFKCVGRRHQYYRGRDGNTHDALTFSLNVTQIS